MIISELWIIINLENEEDRNKVKATYNTLEEILDAFNKAGGREAEKNKLRGAMMLLTQILDGQQF